MGLFSNDWWLNDVEGDLAEFAPITGGGSGSNLHGSLAEWRASLPEDTAVVTAGWSLGAGVAGEYIVDHITVGQKRFGFTGKNRAPEAKDVTATVGAYGSVSIDLAATDPDGDPLTYQVDGANGDAEVSGDTISYEPDGATGTDTFTYTASDSRGGTATGDVTVTIRPNAAPQASAVAGKIAAGAAVDLTLKGTDADGDTLSYTAKGSHGTATITGDTLTFTAASNFHGTTTFSYTVEDGHGESATSTVSVRVFRAESRVAFTLTPSKLKSSSKIKAKVVVTSTGNKYRGVVDLYDGKKKVGHGRVHTNGTQTISFTKKLKKGTHRIHAQYRGTTYTNAKSHSIVVKVK